MASARELVKASPLAALIARDGGEPVVNHLPLVWQDAAGLSPGGSRTGPSPAPGRLIGHFSSNHSLAALLERDDRVLAVYTGPNGYVTPTWYRQCDVPTWNYAVVHVHGRARLIRDEAGLLAVLRTMTAEFESLSGWRFSVPDDLSGAVLSRAIVGIEVTVERVECKLKLSQNRSPADQAGVIAGLEARNRSQDAGLAGLMRSVATASTAADRPARRGGREGE